MRVSKVLHCMQTLYAHSRAVQQGVAYYAHPWDDGVTLLHRPAARSPVIVDTIMQAKGSAQYAYPLCPVRSDTIRGVCYPPLRKNSTLCVTVSHAFEMASALPTSSGGYTQNVYPCACLIASALPTQSVSGGCPYCGLPGKRW